MKIAYFVNQYPKVSHSFIRREINALERCGVWVERFAVRACPKELVDRHDLEEFEKTQYMQNTPVLQVVVAVFQLLLTHPFRTLSTLWSAIKMGRRSERGILIHMFYFIESCLLKKWLDNSEADHVHAHFGTNSAAVALLSHRLGGPPFSFTVHGPEEFDKPEFISLGEKIRCSSFVVAISSYGRAQLYRWVGPVYWDKIKVIRCGLEPAFYGVPSTDYNDSRNLVCVGRLCEQKGQSLLVAAVARLVRKGEDIHLTLAGDGPMREELEQMVSLHKVESYITITGWISSEQVREQILSSRALILPSFAEGLPVVIMEAMALQRPVISTYVAGIPELVVPGENGWLVAAGDVEKLSDIMLEVLHTPGADLERLGRNARNGVLENHNIDTEAGKLSYLFKESSGRRSC